MEYDDFHSKATAGKAERGAALGYGLSVSSRVLALLKLTLLWGASGSKGYLPLHLVGTEKVKDSIKH